MFFNSMADITNFLKELVFSQVILAIATIIGGVAALHYFIVYWLQRKKSDINSKRDEIEQKPINQEHADGRTETTKILKRKEEQTKVEILIKTTGEIYTVAIPLDAKVSNVMNSLIDKFRLPRELKDEWELNYELFSLTRNICLDKSKTFRENDVQENETFFFRVIMEAG